VTSSGDGPERGTVTVAATGEALAVDEAGLTFGRAADCDVVLDPDDVGISRLAGSIEREGSTWWLVNRSGSRPLAVVDELGLRSLLAPGRRAAIEAPVTVVVEGSRGEHALAVRLPVAPAEQGVTTSPEGLETTVGEGVLINDADRLALVALFAGYLEEPPRHDPNPRSYAAAAARLGWPRTTVVKRIEYLRTRLGAAGVPGLNGWNALSNLAEYVLATGIISKADLRLVFPDR
jgi:hypothetical protein